MRSSVIQISSKLQITDVRDVQVGDVIDDGAGGFVRAVKSSESHPRRPGRR